MQREYEPIAKITRPSISGVFPRWRLFRLLDNIHDEAIWVSGPAGSGKTTLVASYLEQQKIPCLWYQADADDADISTFFYYLGMAAKRAAPRFRKPLPLLTPEYLQGIPTFTRRYFENLYARLRPPFVLVFDNYQDVPPDSGFHAAIQEALSIMPKGITVILISRSEPPQPFVRVRANSRIFILGWKEMRFTLDESREIVKRRGQSALPEETLAQVYAKADGWAAGLVLMTEAFKATGIGPQATGISTPRELFDYFAGEVIDKLDSETRDFLLNTSFLPAMTVQTANELTGQDNAGRILSALNRNQMFTEKHSTTNPTYRYHPLFREFLQARMKESLNPQGLLRVRARAASVLEEAGLIEDAASIYLETQNWERLIPVILGRAQTMLMQGRNKTLERWLNGLPRNIVDATPWLLFWSGMCRMGYDLVGMRKGLKQAFKLFTDMNDGSGMALSWSFIIQAINFEFNNFAPLDEMISVYFERIDKALPAAPLPIQARAATAIGLALYLRRPDHPRTRESIEKALSLAGQINDMDNNLHTLITANVYYAWVGDFSRCTALIEQVIRATASSQTPDQYQILSRVVQAGQFLWDISSVEEADRQISDALEFGETIGIHLWDSVLHGVGVCSSLMRGDIARAGQYLEKMKLTLIPSRKETNVQYHMMRCWYRFLQGNYAGALIDAEIALKLTVETGYAFSTIVLQHEMAQVLHALKDNRADEYLEHAFDSAVLSKSALLEFGCRLGRAQFAFDKGNEKTGVEFLREALSLGKQHGYFSLSWWWDPAAMSCLAVKALEHGIETDYVVDLIRVRNLLPDEPPVHIENWPWAVKVFTLGRFSIERNGKAVRFSKKVPRKPIEMLKVLLALGGQNVSETRLNDILWPEADGDSAHRAFNITLIRLRGLIGPKEAVELRDGCVTLDKRYVWADAWALDYLLDSDSAERRNAPNAPEFLTRSIELYKGPFLAGENGAWAVSLRERLKGRVINQVKKLGRHWEEKNMFVKAIDCYRKGLEIDDLAEEFYRRAILCSLKLGRRAEALSLYRRCEKILGSYGVKLSSETETIMKSLISE
jgi:ATP/maltotriose-dependent transcriptional regulator MalT/DNA-binding SARP family transcriptional activator